MKEKKRARAARFGVIISQIGKTFARYWYRQTKKQTTNLVPKSTKLEKMMVRNSQATFSSGDANDIADEMKNADKI